MYPCLVADIGGTNARFSLVTGCENGQYQLAQNHDLSSGDFPSFEACLQTYLDKIEGPMPRHACVALAGPVVGDEVIMTNVNWRFSQASVKQQFGFEVFCALNDFAALANSVPHLSDSDLTTIVAGSAQPDAAKAIVGPGTGLGVAALVPGKEEWVVVPGEGGHVAYAAQNAREMAVAALLQGKGYVCAEALISGRGLVNLFNSLAEIDGHPARVEDASEIAALAWEQQDPLALETWELFCQGVGTVASDAAVMFNAKGGVYLGGGILPRNIEAFKTSGFEARFKDKGVQTGFMSDIPVYLILHKHPALIGAAAWLDDLCGKGDPS
ncbi:glucokinase [Aestuariicella hydrocarbonica]|uniref:Glucokinase n=1 Tax=Pseudomaricurvus hydrocarbonicus TaxID=1470433 RepID=A0A9E5JTV0_9GAMM|nr:glucokinase [Aestuariicella hydrocarbonica]NHO65194.1 glucokinase [Aestuariicella hydrocarbonica]